MTTDHDRQTVLDAARLPQSLRLKIAAWYLDIAATNWTLYAESKSRRHLIEAEHAERKVSELMYGGTISLAALIEGAI